MSDSITTSPVELAGHQVLATPDNRTFRRTVLEEYVNQGYELPAQFTQQAVLERQERWGLRAIDVPLAIAPSVAAWGVPMLNGQYLRHV